MIPEIAPVPDFPSDIDPSVTKEEILAAIDRHAKRSREQLINEIGEQALNDMLSRRLNAPALAQSGGEEIPTKESNP